MAYDVSTKPGTWVRAQTTRRELVLFTIFLLCLVGTGVFLVLAIGHGISVVGIAGGLAVLAWVRPRVNKYMDKHERLYRGTQAEEAVGATLDELRREGWTVMHDLFHGGEGNLDHLVSGPGGVFLLETKAASRYDDIQLTKVRRQAAKLGDELGVWVTPVMCMYRRRGNAFKPRGQVAWVVPRTELLNWLRSQHQPTLEFERLARWADQL